MKRFLITALALIIMLAAVSCSEETPASVPTDTAQQKSSDTVTDDINEDSSETDNLQSSADGILVVYFSREGEQYKVGVIEKGNTEIVAEMIADMTGAVLYEVIPEDGRYPDTYNELTEIAAAELDDGARPVITEPLPDMSQYGTVFIGAPVWWGNWPMIMYTFFESANLDGKVLIPFSTHGGSGLAGFDTKLASAVPGGDVKKGLAIRGEDCQDNQDAVRESVKAWIEELGL